MGLKINVIEVKKQLEDMDTKLSETVENTKSLEGKIRLFIVNDDLDSDVYKGNKNYYESVQLNITRGLICYCETMIEANKKYRSKINSYFNFIPLINEDFIIRTRNSTEKQIKNFKNMSELVFAGQIYVLDKIKKELNDQINKLHEFESSTRNIYDYPKSLLDKFNQGVNCDKKIKYSNGNYNLENIDLSWCNDIDKAWHNRDCYKVKKPKGMSEADYKEYKKKVQEKIDSLMSKDGWDEEAVKVYLNEVNKIEEDKEGSYFEKLNDLNGQTELVGSDIYSRMFEKCEHDSKDKALLVINQMNGEIYKNEMLQLKDGYKFDENMSPHSEFLEEYAGCVEKAYEGKILDDKRIHQFRMYIDRQNINYIRNNYEGETDYDKLIDYSNKENEELDYGSDSRLHNRIYIEGKDKDIDKDILRKTNINKYECNDKVKTSNGLSEYIVDKDGGFVTQWDILETADGKNAGINDGLVESKPSYYNSKLKGKKIVETESFNYVKSGTEHKNLDVKPANWTKGYENDLKIKMKQNWGAIPDKSKSNFEEKKEKDY